MSGQPEIRPIVNLALQGGGSHGAFTWGVLDALLEDGRIEFEGISGTSAGAMNAVALAHGFAVSLSHAKKDPREAARQSLSDLWHGVVSMGAASEAQRAPFDMLLSGLGGIHTPAGQWANQLSDSVSSFWASAMSQSMSPYQSNPLDINPLKSFLERLIDFEALAKPNAFKTLKIFVVATRVSTGKAEVFSGKRLSADAVMASACLPIVFKAVEIEGEHYWDGGYSGNPAIHPLIYNCKSRDVVLVQINPIKRDKLPTTAADIADRMNEITFNASLIAEMRAISFVKRLIAEGKLDAAHYKDLLLHRIDGGEELEDYNAASKISTKSSMIHQLRDLGQSCGKAWLKGKFDHLGKQDTINIARDYLDDLGPSK